MNFCFSVNFDFDLRINEKFSLWPRTSGVRRRRSSFDQAEFLQPVESNVRHGVRSSFAEKIGRRCRSDDRRFVLNFVPVRIVAEKNFVETGDERIENENCNTK